MTDMAKAKLEFYTVDEVAEIMRVKKKTVYGWIKADKLRAVKAGKAYRIPAAAVEQLKTDGTGEE